MNTYQLAYASFTVDGCNLAPDFWTAYFGVTPQIALSKGTPVVDCDNRPLGLIRRSGVWALSSQSSVRSDLLTPHLRYLVQHLSLPRRDLRELSQRAGVRIRFFCYWANYTHNRSPDIPNDIRHMMEDMGGQVDIDEYR